MVHNSLYVEGTVHGQGYARMFAPAVFSPPDAVHGALHLGQSAVERLGRQTVEAGFALLDPPLGRHAFAVGDAFTIADAALFYVERWAPQRGIALPVNVRRHFERLCARPAVRTVRAFWGEA